MTDSSRFVVDRDSADIRHLERDDLQDSLVDVQQVAIDMLDEAVDDLVDALSPSQLKDVSLSYEHGQEVRHMAYYHDKSSHDSDRELVIEFRISIPSESADDVDDEIE